MPTTWKWFIRVADFLARVPDTPNDVKHARVGSNKKDISRALLTVIDAAYLPKEFGGTAEGFFWPTPGSTKSG